MHVLLAHAARQSRSWLIFNVGQKKMKSLALVLIAFALAGCGPFVSGTWNDDPKNWKRAFGETRPSDGISIVRSWYMRTPHFTAEFAWFFELELSDKAKKELVENPDISKMSIASPEDLRSRIYQDRPSWFSPEPLSAYEVFESKIDRDFLIFVEKRGRRSFWTRCQL
jgi:hypothetical protein